MEGERCEPIEGILLYRSQIGLVGFVCILVCICVCVSFLVTIFNKQSSDVQAGTDSRGIELIAANTEGFLYRSWSVLVDI